MTKEELREIERRLKEATPAPWRIREVDYPYDLEGGIDLRTYTIKHKQAVFLAHAHKDIPALLDALDEETKRAREAEGYEDLYHKVATERDILKSCAKELETELSLYKNVFDNPAQAQYIKAKYNKLRAKTH